MIEDEDDGTTSNNFLDGDNEEGGEITIAEQIKMRRNESERYQYCKNVAIKEPKTIPRKSKKKNSKQIVAKSVPPKQLTRAEKLEIFLSNMEIPKYWIRVIPSFLIRENEVNIEECTSKQSFKRMVTLCAKIVENTIKTICPGPGSQSQKIYFRKNE